MNVQLANAISDICGTTGQAILSAIIAGERDPWKRGHGSQEPGGKLAALVVRTWDIYNPRELAYAMTRMYRIFR